MKPIKTPKTSFSAILKDVEAPKDYSTKENRMAWYTAVIKALKPIGKVFVGVGKQAAANAATQAIEKIQDEVEHMGAAASVGLSPSEVHESENVAIHTMKGGLKMMEALSVSPHYRMKITHDQLRVLRKILGE